MTRLRRRRMRRSSVGRGLAKQGSVKPQAWGCRPAAEEIRLDGDGRPPRQSGGTRSF